MAAGSQRSVSRSGEGLGGDGGQVEDRYVEAAAVGRLDAVHRAAEVAGVGHHRGGVLATTLLDQPADQPVDGQQPASG